MKTSSYLCFIILVVNLLSIDLSGSPYEIIDLGVLPNETSSIATALNNLGQVVGYSGDNGFLWSGGEMVKIPDFASNTNKTRPQDINNSGVVVGLDWTGDRYRAIMFDSVSGISTGLPTPQGSYLRSKYVRAINDSGDYVGTARSSRTNNDDIHYVKYHDLSRIDFREKGGGFIDINNQRKVLRIRAYAGGYIWDESDTLVFISRLPNRGFAWPVKFNDFDEVVGYANDWSQPNLRPFFWSESTGSLDLAGNREGIGKANSINNLSHVVGYFDDKATLWVQNQLFYLNDLIPDSSGWELTEAIDINDYSVIVGRGVINDQIQAFLLQPSGFTAAKEFIPERSPIVLDRLARWDGVQWNNVSFSEIVSGNVYVFVHGWAPGWRDWVEQQSELDLANAWNAHEHNGQTGPAQNITKMAEAIAEADPNAIVLAYSWIDDSATPDDSLLARWSRRHTDENGARLAQAMTYAIANKSQVGVHIIGHSHGARVAAVATSILEKTGALRVNHLTILDSPERWANLNNEPWYGGAANHLWEVLKNINIGQQPDSVFVDNYYASAVGRKYGDICPGVVDVGLIPDSGLIAAHGYPVDWYAQALSLPNIGLAWSPLLGTGYTDLENLYFQDWGIPGIYLDRSKEFVLRSGTDTVVGPDLIEYPLEYEIFLVEGQITYENGKVILWEASPAFYSCFASFTEGDQILKLKYHFVEQGDGDKFGIWIDDDLSYLIAGNSYGVAEGEATIDISQVNSGNHTITLALYSEGEANSIIEVSDISVIRPQQSTSSKYGDWAMTYNLKGSISDPGSIVFEDGLPNLVKYAFNLNGAASDNHRFGTETATSGLPVIEFYVDPMNIPYWRLNVLRRRNSGLIYTPVTTSFNDPMHWNPVVSEPIVEQISDEWEVANYNIPVESSNEGGLAVRVRVEVID